MSSQRQPRNRIPVIALLAANMISELGNVIALVAIPWFVLETTGSAAKTGLTGFFAILPVVLAGLLGGVVVDRLGHRRASIIADVFSGVSVALIPLLYLTVGLSLWQLLCLVFLGALLDLPGSTARQSLVPELAELGEIQLERVNAAYQSIRQGALLVGPPLTGLLILLLGPAQVLWLDAASFALSAMLVAVGIPAGLRIVEDDARPSAGYLADLIEGWQFIRRERVIFSLTLTNALSNLVGGPLFAVVLPVYASQVLGNPVDLGLMLSGMAVGTLAGALLYGLFGHQVSRRWVYTGSWLVGALPFWALAGTPPLIIAMTTLVLLGLSNGPINPLMYTLSQERTPARLRGRVFGARIALANVTAPLGMLAAGVLIERAGLGLTLVLMALSQTAIAFYVLLSSSFRELDYRAGQIPERMIERRYRRTFPRPAWRLLGFGLLLIASGLAIITLIDVSRDLPIEVVGAAALILAGWILAGAALWPGKSMLLGVVAAAGLYLLVGALVAGAMALPRSPGAAEELMPASEPYVAFALIALLWPLAVMRLADRRARHG